MPGIREDKIYFNENSHKLILAKYLELLGQIDIAIFAHKRQQAMGNAITLLGLGKKVYMRDDVTSWQLFKNIGVKVFELNKLDLMPLDKCTIDDNQSKIRNYFSLEKLKDQLKHILED